MLVVKNLDYISTQKCYYKWFPGFFAKTCSIHNNIEIVGRVVPGSEAQKTPPQPPPPGELL